MTKSEDPRESSDLERKNNTIGRPDAASRRLVTIWCYFDVWLGLLFNTIETAYGGGDAFSEGSVAFFRRMLHLGAKRVSLENEGDAFVVRTGGALLQI